MAVVRCAASHSLLYALLRISVNSLHLSAMGMSNLCKKV